jgi:hypothetical protein
MEYISHRGNIKGVSRQEENSPAYIEQAIKRGYSVEVDVWKIGDDLYLGHDSPSHLVSLEFLKKHARDLYLHCKNHDAFEYFHEDGFEIFWHTEEDFCLTSRGRVWAKPNACKIKNRIEVQLTYDKNFNTADLFGICSDEIDSYKKQAE